jgi:predicted glutamine amidotransferase
MCIAIYKPADKSISLETLKICYENNDDGCGFAFINGEGKLEIFKTMEFDAWWLAYQEALLESPDSPFLIHFRIGTHGEKSTFNCHPFWVDNNHVFMHNGTVVEAPLCPDKKRSDTQMFNDTVLKQLPENWFYSPGLKTLVEHYIKHSKIVVMNNKGEVSIFNEKLGEWADGVWYSNTGYKSVKVIHLPYYANNRNRYTRTYLDDGSWLLDGKRYRWNRDAVCSERYDDVKKMWRLWDNTAEKYKYEDGTPGNIYYACAFCEHTFLWEHEVGVVEVDDDPKTRQNICKDCWKPLHSVENLRMVCGFKVINSPMKIANGGV